MRLTPESYAGKIQRAFAAGAREIAEKKRFPAVTTPETRQALASFRKEAHELMLVFPEVVAVGIFGSYMKGYPITHGDIEERSDVDSILFFDYSRSSTRADVNHEQQILVVSQFFIKKMEEHGLPTSPDILNVEENSLQKMLDEKNYVVLARLFFPTIGSEIKKYRKWVLEKLKNQALGEEDWEDISHHLAAYESFRFPQETREKRDRMYKMNIQQAIERYC